MVRISVCLALLYCCSVVLYAEQVTLKNGDRVTGTIVSMDDKKLTVKTDYAGDITIDRAAVAQFSSQQPLVVTRTDNQVVTGPVTQQDSSIVVNGTGGAQTIPPIRLPTKNRSTPDFWKVGAEAVISAWVWRAAILIRPT
jgi:hypothetical protein